MKTNNGSPKRLTLELETLRHLKTVELDNVVGGVDEGALISLSVGCQCETKRHDCPTNG